MNYTCLFFNLHGFGDILELETVEKFKANKFAKAAQVNWGLDI